jgi:hypothetical protein
LGISAHYKLSDYWSLFASIGVENGYKVYTQINDSQRVYYHSMSKFGMSCTPFKNKKWQFEGGYAHQFLPSVLFLAAFYPDCVSGISTAQLLEENRRRKKLQTMQMNLFGYTWSVARKLKISKNKNLHVSIESSSFFGDIRYLNKSRPSISAVNVGLVF